jgi:hypothetical protein
VDPYNNECQNTVVSMLLWISLSAWAAALAVGALDGLYFHLWKFRLHARRQSRSEHVMHTVRACLLGPILWLAFVAPRLDLLVALVAIDTAVVIADVWLETASRRDLGGIPRAEYVVHVVANTLHTGAMTLAMATWWLSPAAEVPHLLRGMAEALAACTVPVAVLHVALMFWTPRAQVGGAAAA